MSTVATILGVSLLFSGVLCFPAEAKGDDQDDLELLMADFPGPRIPTGTQCGSCPAWREPLMSRLIEIERDKAIPFVRGKLDSPDEGILCHAISFFASVPAPEVVDRLFELLVESNRLVAFHARRALLSYFVFPFAAINPPSYAPVSEGVDLEAERKKFEGVSRADILRYRMESEDSSRWLPTSTFSRHDVVEILAEYIDGPAKAQGIALAALRRTRLGWLMGQRGPMPFVRDYWGWVRSLTNRDRDILWACYWLSQRKPSGRDRSGRTRLRRAKEIFDLDEGRSLPLLCERLSWEERFWFSRGYLCRESDVMMWALRFRAPELPNRKREPLSRGKIDLGSELWERRKLVVAEMKHIRAETKKTKLPRRFSTSTERIKIRPGAKCVCGRCPPRTGQKTSDPK